MRFVAPGLLLLVLAAPVSALPPADVRVHEWGVWKIEEGRLAHLDDLRRESPPFVRQAMGPTVAPGGTLSRKPVVYVYADRPVDLDVRVRFTGGNAWLFFPGIDREGERLPLCAGGGALSLRDRAMAAPCETLGRLHWRVRAEPDADPSSLPPVDRGHFWNRMRDVPSAVLRAADGTREKFLFYDGPVAFPAAFAVRREPGAVRLERTGVSGASDVVLSKDGRWVSVSGLRAGLAALTHTDRVWPLPAAPLAVELSRRLHSAGLTDAEARALVETWRPEIEAPGLRAFWLLPRADYDALLPLEVSPAPREVVRVGLVIQTL
jgi:hypothetical protein